MNSTDILCIAILAVLILLALRSIRRQIGGGRCGCGCQGCRRAVCSRKGKPKA